MVTHGVVLPTRGCVLKSTDATELAKCTQMDVLELAQTAASSGYNSVWVGDSILAKPRHEPLITLAGLATQLDDTVLGTAVYLPSLRHPVHIAHQLATISFLGNDSLSIGVGVGRGSEVQNEYEIFDYDYNTRGRLLDEVLDIIDGLLAGKEINHSGEFYELKGANLGLEPARPPEWYIPFRTLDPDRGFPRRVRQRIAAHGTGWLPHTIDADLYEFGLEQIINELRDTDRNPKTFDPALYQNVIVSDRKSDAIKQAREFYLDYYPRMDSLSDADIRSMGIFGPPEDVQNHIEKYREAGVETFVTRFPTKRNQEEQIERYIAAVS